MVRFLGFLALVGISPVLWSAAQGWRISFFHDKPNQNFDIADFYCPAAGRCIALGAMEEQGRFIPHAVVTTDAGAHWTSLVLPEVPISTFFLNANIAWMVAEKGIWQSRDGGNTWKKISSEHDLERVYFLDENRGFAAGDRQKLLATTDGGLKWTPVRTLEGLGGPADANAFEWIFFDGPNNGAVVGEVTPANASLVPSWLEPRRHHSNWVLLGWTSNGGESWKFTKIRRADDLVNVTRHSQRLWFFFQPMGSEAQSEIARCAWGSDELKPLVTDSDALLVDATREGDTTYVAAVEREGRLMDVPIPGKLRIFSGADFDRMTRMSVDYRAVALHVRIAVAPDGQPFAATDTGMILKLAR